MPFQILVQAAETEVSLLGNALILLQNIGFFQVVVPFILVFAVVFAILEKSKLLGDDSKSVNSIIALVLALTTTGAAAVTGILATMIPLVMLTILILLLFFLTYGLFAGELSTVSSGMKIGLGIGVAIAIALIFLHSANLLDVLTGEILGMVLLIAAVITVIAVISTSKTK